MTIELATPAAIDDLDLSIVFAHAIHRTRVLIEQYEARIAALEKALEEVEPLIERMVDSKIEDAMDSLDLDVSATLVRRR